MELLKKRIRLNKSRLSVSELQVYDLLMNSPSLFLEASISELAKQAYVSTATVSRTIKKLGFRGMAQLKLEVEKNLSSSPTQETFEGLLDEEYHLTIKKLNDADVLKAISLIKKSNSCEFFGLGPSHAVAVDGARRLVFCGKLANARAEWDELHMVANNVCQKDLVIFISASGESQVILEYATIF